MPLPAAGATALKLAPYAMALFGGRTKKVDWAGLERWMAGLRPSGYLTPEDLAAGELTRARGTRQARASGAAARLEAFRRARQRGVDTAPAMETTLGRIGQAEAGAAQGASDTAEQQLYNVRLGNQRFEQGKAMALIGTRLGEAVRGRAQGDAQRAELYNSLLAYTPVALGSLQKLSSVAGIKPGGASSFRRYNPATGMFEQYKPDEGVLGDPIDSGNEWYG